MLTSPLTGVGRVHADNGNAAAGRHGGQPGTELAGGYAGHDAAEPLAALRATKGFPADDAGIGKVEVLHHHSGTSCAFCVVEEFGYRRPDPPIPA